MFCFFVGIGCGGPTVSNIVSGKVTYKGQALNSGTIELHGPKDVVRSSGIGTDGTYTIADPAIGENTVVVKTPPPPSAPPGVKMPGSDIVPVKVPAQYGVPQTSGVKQTIAAGKTTLDIDLK
ncbi:MAG: hypothetical protein U0744_12590 [Gemmataceae bacterium]